MSVQKLEKVKENDNVDERINFMLLNCCSYSLWLGFLITVLGHFVYFAKSCENIDFYSVITRSCHLIILKQKSSS